MLSYGWAFKNPSLQASDSWGVLEVSTVPWDLLDLRNLYDSKSRTSRNSIFPMTSSRFPLRVTTSKTQTKKGSSTFSFKQNMFQTHDVFEKKNQPSCSSPDTQRGHRFQLLRKLPALHSQAALLAKPNSWLCLDLPVQAVDDTTFKLGLRKRSRKKRVISEIRKPRITPNIKKIVAAPWHLLLH